MDLLMPCQLLYWNAGQQVRYTDRFAICRGDVSLLLEAFCIQGRLNKIRGLL